jgi:hypothetical protein
VIIIVTIVIVIIPMIVLDNDLNYNNEIIIVLNFKPTITMKLFSVFVNLLMHFEVGLHFQRVL